MDGRVSHYDWVGTVETTQTPFVLNPPKGYYMTANHRICPENSHLDVGATAIATGRSLRLVQIIEDGIKAGKKFTSQDMINMQMDYLDVFARELTPHIVQIAEGVVRHHKAHQLSRDQADEISKMVETLRGFTGEMTETSVQATVYNYWQYFFYGSLFQDYTVKGKKEQLRLGKTVVDGQERFIPFWQDTKRFYSLIDNYRFSHFYHRLIHKISSGEITDKYNAMCKGKYFDRYEGPDHCAHNVARAFFEVALHLNKTLGTDSKEWIWRNAHVNEYPHAPFSMTPLKPLFHREVPIGGNGYTPGVSKYQMGEVKQNKIFKSSHVGSYKQVIEYGDDFKTTKNFMSLDTGMSGNLLAGHYFNMNRNHLYGDLYQVSSDFKEVEGKAANYKLEILPPKSKRTGESGDL